MLKEIRELNRSWLLLAQRLLQIDRSSGMRDLGISAEMADLVERLSLEQLENLARATQLLCRLRPDEQIIVATLATKIDEPSDAFAHRTPAPMGHSNR